VSVLELSYAVRIYPFFITMIAITMIAPLDVAAHPGGCRAKTAKHLRQSP
jgi:hypothetical protein